MGNGIGVEIGGHYVSRHSPPLSYFVHTTLQSTYENSKHYAPNVEDWFIINFPNPFFEYSDKEDYSKAEMDVCERWVRLYENYP